MNPIDMEIEAQLTKDSETVNVQAKYSSKYSLWIRFPNGRTFRDGTEFNKLVLNIKGVSVDLGKCQLVSEPNIEGFAGRLIFISDVYDFKSLLTDREVVKLQSAFQNLQLVLPYKRKIKPEFKDYAADLTYDLSIYKNLFDRVDSEHEGEPDHIRSLVQKAIIYTEGRKFMEFLDDRLEELENIVKSFCREEHERHGFYFRRQMWNYIMCSEFMSRTNLKPRGYSGDSAMMTMLYQNDYRGESTFAKLMHKHPCEHPAAQAVRNRRRMIAGLLREFRRSHPPAPGERISVLSVACGSAYELRDILATPEDCDSYHFALFDQDRQALLEVARWIDQREKDLQHPISAQYLNESVRTMLTSPQLKGDWGQFNFIYSMGLFDYLTPPVAKGVLGKMISLLKPGGELLVGNFHLENPSRFYMEYWLDWVLFYRNEADFHEMLPPDFKGEVKVMFENTRSQMFLHLKMPVE